MIEFRDDIVSIDGAQIRLDHRIVTVGERGARIIVLLDPDAYIGSIGQFQNLLALSREGVRLWTAELATTTSGDRYYRILNGPTLRAWSVYSYVCDIDDRTGHIMSKEFVK